jgi:beta-glucanase (GH16 family)
MSRKILSLSIAGIAFLAGVTVTLSAAERPDLKLIWSDEFNGPNGSSPDASKWSIVTGGGGWGNKELESYTDRAQNVQQSDGNLVITARKESFSGSDKIQRDYTSARLQTKDHFAQAYGRFEARMKLPSGKGIWPAFWLLGNNADTTHWPACGEIDIMETIGDPHTMYSTLHGPGYSGKNAISAKFPLPAGQAVDDAFHVYALEWTPERIRFLFDDQLIVEHSPKDLPVGTRWVYDHPFFVLLNFAVGGNWPGNPDEKTSFPQSLLVDYVRVYGAGS